MNARTFAFLVSAMSLCFATGLPVHAAPLTKPWTDQVGGKPSFAPLALSSGGALAIVSTNDSDRSVFLDSEGKVRASIAEPESIEQAPIELRSGNVLVVGSQHLRVYSPEGALLWQQEFSSTHYSKAGIVGLLNAGHFGLSVGTDTGSSIFVFTESGKLAHRVPVPFALCGQVWSESEDASNLDLRALTCEGEMFRLSAQGEVLSRKRVADRIEPEAHVWLMDDGVRAISDRDRVLLVSNVALPVGFRDCRSTSWVQISKTQLAGICIDYWGSNSGLIGIIGNHGEFYAQPFMGSAEASTLFASSTGPRYISDSGELVWADLKANIGHKLYVCASGCGWWKATSLKSGRVLAIDTRGGVMLLDEQTQPFRVSVPIDGKIALRGSLSKVFQIAPSKAAIMTRSSVSVLDTQGLNISMAWDAGSHERYETWDSVLVQKRFVFYRYKQEDSTNLQTTLKGTDLETGTPISWGGPSDGYIGQLMDFEPKDGQLALAMSNQPDWYNATEWSIQYLKWNTSSSQMETQERIKLPCATSPFVWALGDSKVFVSCSLKPGDYGASDTAYLVDRSQGVQPFAQGWMDFVGVTPNKRFITMGFDGAEGPKMLSFWDFQGQLAATYKPAHGKIARYPSEPNAEGDVAFAEEEGEHLYFTVVHSDGTLALRVEREQRLANARPLSDGRWLVPSGSSYAMELLDKNGQKLAEFEGADQEADDDTRYFELEGRRLLIATPIEDESVKRLDIQVVPLPTGAPAR